MLTVYEIDTPIFLCSERRLSLLTSRQLSTRKKFSGQRFQCITNQQADGPLRDVQQSAEGCLRWRKYLNDKSSKRDDDGEEW